MKTFFASLFLCSLVLFVVDAKAITADLTNATMEPLTPTSIKLHNVVVDIPERGITRNYWGILQFDIQTKTFALSSYGPEPTISKIWTIHFKGVPGSYAEGAADLLLTTDPVNRVISEQVTGVSGEIANGVCVTMKIIQGLQNLVVAEYPGIGSIYPGMVLNTTIYACENFSCFSGGEEGGMVSQGTSFPAWFDFNAPFTLVCQVNGSNTSLSWTLDQSCPE